MSKLSNSIENGNNNNQAARDLTINNNHLGTLDALVMEHLAQDLMPKLQEEAESIKSSIGSQIREIISQQVINPLKRDLEIENIKAHFDNIRQQVDINTSSNKKFSEHEKLKRTELFLSGLEQIQDIPLDEKILSDLWEGWFIALKKGESTSDLEFYFEKMRNLRPDEGVMLWTIFDKTRSLFPFILLENLNEKGKYVRNELKDKKLVKFNYSLLALIIISLGIISFLVYYFNIVMFMLIALAFGGIFLIPYIMIIVIGFIVNSYTVNFYKPTWVGKGIASFRRKNNKK